MLCMISSVYQPDAPPAEAVARMMMSNEAAVNVGALIALDGLHPRARGARVACAGGQPNVTDGPFTGPKAALGGSWMIQTRHIRRQ
jgi:hypothetical protein